jgi:hypothetical protein
MKTKLKKTSKKYAKQFKKNNMNKLKVTMMTLMMCFMTITLFAQTDSVYVIKSSDEMSGKTYIYGSKNLVISNDTKEKGFIVDTYIDDNLSIRMITVVMVGIGNCNENDEIIILFENGEKITKKSWKSWNCDGEAYFNITKLEMEMLRTLPMAKIRMTNGISYDSYTGDVIVKDKRYFIQLLYALDNKLILENKN